MMKKGTLGLLVFVAVVLVSLLGTSAIQTTRKSSLEARVSRTAFGRQMLQTVRSKLSATSTTGAKSFNAVQAFIDQVYKRVLASQKEEATAHASQVKSCERTLVEAIANVAVATKQVKTDTAASAVQNNILKHIPLIVKASKDSTKASETLVAKMNAKLLSLTALRKEAHDSYRRKFTEAYSIVQATQSIVNKMNLLYPSVASTNKTAYKPVTPPSTIKKPIVTNKKNTTTFIELFETFGRQSDNHLSSFVDEFESLASPLVANNETDTLRTLLTLFDSEVRKYLTRMNADETASLKANNLRQADAAAIKIKENKNLAAQKIILKDAEERIAAAKKEFTLVKEELAMATTRLNNYKEQLRTRTAYCKAQTVTDKKGAAERVEQLKTLQALRLLVSRHIAGDKKAAVDAAQKAALARQKTVEAAKRTVLAPKKNATTHTTAAKNTTLVVHHKNGTVSTVTVPVKANSSLLHASKKVVNHTHGPMHYTGGLVKYGTVGANAVHLSGFPKGYSAGHIVQVGNKTVNLTVINPATTKHATNCTGSCAAKNMTAGWFSCAEIKNKTGTTTSGVYLLYSAVGAKPFKAYCEMKKAGGGWMLAFKQYNYESGSVKYTPALKGSSGLLIPVANETTKGSLLWYGRPKQFLFQASHDHDWFISRSIPAWQKWTPAKTARYCMYSKYTAGSRLVVSHKWTNTTTHLWPDTAIQMMSDSYPSISALTIGEAKAAEAAPQCMTPQCSANSNGRFDGTCQKGSKGEGNWLVYTR